MNYEYINNNKAFISGEIIEQLEYSHTVCGEDFYQSKLKIMRLSNSYDIIPITISKNLIDDYRIRLNSIISGYGQFRSYNRHYDTKNKLMLTMFIKEIVENEQDTNPNLIEITGYVCKEPIFRTTPFKREICDMLIAVNRNYNKSDYLPCIAWGRNARYCKNFTVGDKITILGRIQSREYQKRISDEESITKTAYEISISRIVSQDDQNEFENIDDLAYMTECEYNYNIEEQFA